VIELQVTISKNDTVILDGAGDKKAIEERAEQVLCQFSFHRQSGILCAYCLNIMMRSSPARSRKKSYVLINKILFSTAEISD